MRSASKIAAALALMVALAVPATAGAAGPTGNTTLLLGKAKAKLLDQRGISFGGVGGADTAGRETRLQIAGGAIDTAGARFNHAGALRFLAGTGDDRRVVRLGAPRLELTPQRSLLSAKLDGTRRVVFKLGELKPGSLAIDPQKGSLQLQGARLAWNRPIARTIGKRLGARLPRGVLGTLRTSAATLKSEAEGRARSADEPPSACPPGQRDRREQRDADLARARLLDPLLQLGGGAAGDRGRQPGRGDPRRQPSLPRPAGGRRADAGLLLLLPFRQRLV